MADYIDREELLKLYSIEELGDVNINELQVPFMVVRQNIIDMPSADVRKNVKGQWNDVACYNVRCSVCGGVMSAPFPYCSWCGSEMVNHG